MRITCSVVLCLLLAACGSNSQKGAASGAKYGTIGGAVGGAVSSLIWGGNIAQGAARGAAVGAASGAAVGAAHGHDIDKKQQANEKLPNSQEQQLIQQFGEDNYAALKDLAQCDYSAALKGARAGQQFSDADHREAGLWLEALTYADRSDYSAAEPVLSTIATDYPNKWSSVDKARLQLRDTLKKVRGIRFQYGLAPSC